MLNFSRVDRSIFAEWWWTVDRLLLVSIVGLTLFGLIFSMAASPSVALKLGLEEFHFVKRQVLFLAVGFCLMMSVSLLNPRQLRRLSLIVVLCGFSLMLYTLLYGVEVKGSRRWVELFGWSLQPSEFLKPFFVLISAWLFVEARKRPELPAIPFAIILLAIFLLLLLYQPDLGQALLVFFVWGSLFFVAGMQLIWVFVFLVLFVIVSLAAYLFFPHVGARIDRFLDPSSGDSYQIEKALESIARGGWLGQGPGEGEVKGILPDSHTDFIFSVMAEEFGILVCLGLLCAFMFIIARVFFMALQQRDHFARFAASGLIIMFGLQALINVAVNLALIPTKGMTLPFISSGGSSILSNFLLMGMILALTRRSASDGAFFLDSQEVVVPNRIRST